MPALLILAVISWLLGSGKSRSKAGEPALFTALEVRPGRRWGAFFVSIAAHAFGLLLVLIASDLFSGPDDDFLPRQLARHALVIRLPDHIYLAPATGRTFPATAHLKRTPPVTVRRKDLRKYAEGGVEAKLTAPSTTPARDAQPSLFSMAIPPLDSPQAEPRKFELPEMATRAAATQTVLQAELPPDLPPQVEKRLPQLLFWDAETAKPPEHPIAPGNLTTRLEAPKLNSIPRLETPNGEAVTADVSVHAAASTNTETAIALPPATTMPLRILEPAKEPDGPTSIDPFTGHPIHVLALSPDPAPLTDALKALFIPAGNQLARLPGAPPLFGIPGLGDGAGGPGASGTGETADDAASEGGSGPAELVHSLPGGGRLFGMLSPPGLNGTPLRVIHPNNGVFDIVVVQSSSSQTFPESADVLSGRPIYTVYLQVGAPKEWILQYCVPNMAGPIQTGNVVKLGNPEPVGAPYPTVTVRPPEDWRHGADYLLVHGFLDESGRFREMKILQSSQPASPTTDELLQYLAYWEFRPALQDGRPVKVEVILAVPPDHMS
jgi:hypothetical protein